MHRSIVVQDVKKTSVVRPLCLFFWCWVYPLQHQFHAEEKISLFILDALFEGFHCFSGRHLFHTGSAWRGKEERLPFFARRKMIDPQLSRCTTFVGALDASCYTGLQLSLRRLLLEHSVLSHCFPVWSCCVDELADLMLCAVFYVLVASGIFQPSSLAKKANGSECLQGCAQSVAFSSRNFKVTRSGCECLSPRFCLLLIPVSHVSLEGLPQVCGGGMKKCPKAVFLAGHLFSSLKRHLRRVRWPSGPGCTRRRWL